MYLYGHFSAICSLPYIDIQFNEVIGRGTFGVVHKGIWKGETVALKVLPLPSGVGHAEIFERNREMAALRYRMMYIITRKFH